MINAIKKGWFFLAFVCMLMWTPLISVNHISSHADKILHYLLYGGVLYVFLNITTVKKAVVICVVLSIILEWSQQFISYRSMSLWDEVANLAGIATVWILYLVSHLIRNRL